MSELRTTLDAGMALKLAEFARACKAALRAVSLYPGGHPAIGATLGRLTELTGVLTAAGPLTLEVRPQNIHIADAAPAKPDLAAEEQAIRAQDAAWMKAAQSRDAAAEATILAP